MLFSSLSKYSDWGLLGLRFVFGSMFVYYGFPKLFAGAQGWGQLGAAMGSIGISFAPVFWGFMAAFSMFFGGICLAFGLFFRPACMLLAFTMFVASAMHLKNGEGFLGAGHAIEDGAVFFGLIFIGPGRFSLDVILWGR
ncbi:MAG TPA: DoxX family protein [Candidatus Omnitrophica bacterium]|nr:DoxX family protein [Candidatus Omnitrophota bacterium]